MPIPSQQNGNAFEDAGLYGGFWDAEVDIARTPSPGIATKRMRMTFDDIANDFRQEPSLGDDDFHNLWRVQKTPESLGYETIGSFKNLFSSGDSSYSKPNGRRKMQTGCIPCL